MSNEPKRIPSFQRPICPFVRIPRFGRMLLMITGDCTLGKLNRFADLGNYIALCCKVMVK